MKFLHLADLHLGKRLNDFSFLEDQVRLLCQVEEIARSERADAVLIAGDVYQKASPQSEAMAAFDQFITRLKEMGHCSVRDQRQPRLRPANFLFFIAFEKLGRVRQRGL